MAFPEHYLLQFGGDLRGDIWSCGIRFAPPSLPFDVLDAGEQQTLADDMADDITAWMVATGSGWSNAAKLRYVKFNRITADGRYFDTANTQQRRYDTPAFPTGPSATTYPNQVALVISWVTAAARGRASKGRIFMPAPAIALAADTGRLYGPPDSVHGQSVADAAATFLNNLNNQPGVDTPGVGASVVSKVDGTVRAITGVRVGNVLDTMRSRRNALDETYFSAALA